MTHVHAQWAGQLDWEHKDPLDRMLVAQCTLEKLFLISVDQVIQAKIKTLW